MLLTRIYRAAAALPLPIVGQDERGPQRFICEGVRSKKRGSLRHSNLRSPPRESTPFIYPHFIYILKQL